MPVTLFVENVTIIDYAYLRPDVRIAGDSLILTVELRGELDHNGFIVDFGKLKPMVKQLVDSELDHRLLLPDRDRELIVEEIGGRVIVRYGTLTYEAPPLAIARLDAIAITHDTISQRIQQLVAPHLSPNVSALRCHLARDARAEQQASFAYTHGLRHHDGNCQRLLHGHRGVFVVIWDGIRDPELEGTLIQRFDGAHFASARDVSGDAVAYRAAQGDFTALLPAGRIVSMAVEPTIENIAQFAFEELVRGQGLDARRLMVRAYEGPNKGAMFSVPSVTAE